MRERGEVYWGWADPALHCRNHDERLSSGSLLNVQVRYSPSKGTQLFLGVYGRDGRMVAEESFDSRPGETMSQAMEWGLSRARTLAEQHGLHKRGERGGASVID